MAAIAVTVVLALLALAPAPARPVQAQAQGHAAPPTPQPTAFHQRRSAATRAFPPLELVAPPRAHSTPLIACRLNGVCRLHTAVCISAALLTAQPARQRH